MATTNGLRHVFDGYKVLDFTQVLPGPTVTRLMAEMGAEIINLELAPAGDFSRVSVCARRPQRLLHPTKPRQEEHLRGREENPRATRSSRGWQQKLM